jgi:hypothetical protein
VIFNNEGKAESENLARALEKTRDECGVLGGRMGCALQLVYVAIALAAMCLLTKKKPLWLLALLLAVVAAGFMVSVRMSEQAGMAAMPAAQRAPAGKNGG